MPALRPAPTKKGVMMDPDANLVEQRRVARRLLALDRPLVEIAADASRLAELVEALDQWCATGGFLLAAWR